MAFNSYIDLGSSGILQRKETDLESEMTSSVVSALNSAGLTDLKVNDELILNTGNARGYLKVGVVDGATTILASTDHINWSPIINESQSSQGSGSTLDYEWDSTTAYAVDEIVISNGMWYIATAGNTNQTPAPGSVYWRVLSPGNRRVIVTTLAQLVATLGAPSSVPLHIIISGELTDGGSSTATTLTVNNSAVVIESYENDSIAAYSLNFVAGAGLSPVIYWHSHGMKLSTTAISATGCRLYLADVNLTRNAACTLSGNIVYQRSTGIGYFNISGAGPSFNAWETATAEGEYVPLELGTLSQLHLDQSILQSSRLYLYAKDPDARQGGYLTLEDITQEIAGKAGRSWRIDAQGPASALPEAGTVDEGYVYYATDTGNLYRKGASAWEGPYAFRGPAGSATAGSDGVSPTVSITNFTSDGRTGREITITDAEHPSGQSFSLYDGLNGVATVPPISASAVALAAGSAPTASVTRTINGYNMSLGIPVGSTPTFTCSTTVLSAGDDPSVEVISSGATNIKLNFGIPAVASIDSLLSANLPLVLSGGVMSLNKTSIEFGHSHTITDITGLASLSSAVAEVTSVVSSKANLTDIHDAVITVRQSGRQDQTFTLNQANSVVIELGEGSAGGTDVYVNVNDFSEFLKSGTRSSTPQLNSYLYTTTTGRTLTFVDSTSSVNTYYKTEFHGTGSMPTYERVGDKDIAFYLEPSTYITLTNGLSSVALLESDDPLLTLSAVTGETWGGKRTINIWLNQVATAPEVASGVYTEILSFKGSYGSAENQMYEWKLIPSGNNWVLTDGSHSLNILNVSGGWHMMTFVEDIYTITCYKDAELVGVLDKGPNGKYMLYRIKLAGSYCNTDATKYVQVYFSNLELYPYHATQAQIRYLYDGTYTLEIDALEKVAYYETGELVYLPGYTYFAIQPVVWDGTVYDLDLLKLKRGASYCEGEAHVYIKTRTRNMAYTLDNGTGVDMTNNAGDIVHLRLIMLGTQTIVKSETL